MRLLVCLVLACGGSPVAKQPKLCDQPEPGKPMTSAQCSCREGNVQLSVGRAVELHCEPGETELGTVLLDGKSGWCCK
ncbi:MAG: hypothetical protein ABI867_09540 [Kofleriaceae bacterium]